MQLLGRLIQGMDQRVARDLENPGKRLIQFQDVMVCRRKKMRHTVM